MIVEDRRLFDNRLSPEVVCQDRGDSNMKTLLLVTVACGAAFGWSSLRAQDTEKLNSLDYVTFINTYIGSE